MMKTDTLLLNSNIFKTKYVYYQYFWINHVFFYILYQLFQASCRNFLSIFDPKYYCYRFKFDCITYFFIGNVFLYSKLSYMLTSLQLEAWALIKAELDAIMLFNFLKSMLYKTDILRQLKKIIISTLILVKYRYIAISKKM